MLLPAALCCTVLGTQAAERPAPGEAPDVAVQANYLNAVGSTDAASEGTVTRALLQRRPTLRPAEVLEFVPGVIVSQHSGGGKANQYYLRGFNLDHGTDFATWVDGMPANMPSHAHGQGYTDLNWLIPELIDRIHYRKGPYAAEDGDFASAGSARLKLVDGLPRGLASVTLGSYDHARVLLANSVDRPQGGTWLYALEASHHHGPWDQGEGLKRVNGVLRYTQAEGDTRQSWTAMAYRARWRATDQVPQRAVASGLIGRFGAIDPTDRGDTERLSLSWNRLTVVHDGEWQLSAWALASRLTLFSNFTYKLDNPTTGDQFEQAESRQAMGLQASRLWRTTLAGRETEHTAGLQLRHDHLSPVGLYTAAQGQRTGVTQESRVNDTLLGLYAQSSTRWLPWLRSIAGIRHDQVAARVRSSIADNSGSRQAHLMSPKLSLVFGPWARTEFFAHLGQGYHRNDARGMTARVAARSGDPVDAAVPLVRTRGAEFGLRSEWLPGLQTSLSVWRLDLASELVFVGDAGETEASGASRRHGIEFNNHWQARPWLLLDADLAFSQARFRSEQGEAPNAGRHVPGAVRTVAALGATLTDFGPWSAQLQLRYFGPRPLIEDNSVRSKGTTLAYLRVGHQLTRDVKVALDVFNLFNRRASDIDYFYTSRLSGEPATGIADLHSHPAEPRSFRLTVAMSF
jgi:outer membrane receptor for ferrienterochelin and colicin